MYDKMILETFLEQQGRLFAETVADNIEEAAEFLEMCGACVCDTKEDVLSYMKEYLDVSVMTDEEILNCEEVFPIKDGRFLIVEG